MKTPPLFSDLRPPAPMGFDEFWKAYPRKEARFDAEKAWRKARPGATDLDAMIKWLEAAKLSRQWRDVAYIPHPATWINGRRWEGDPPPADKAYVGYQAPAPARNPELDQERKRMRRHYRYERALVPMAIRGAWLPYWELRWIECYERMFERVPF